jgi:MscS family membrane protein
MNYETVMGDLKSFWEIVVEVWQQGLFGVQIGKVLTAAFIFIIFLMLRKIIATQIIKRAKTLADKTTTQIDNKVVGALEQPITMIPVVLGLFSRFSISISKARWAKSV